MIPFKLSTKLGACWLSASLLVGVLCACQAGAAKGEPVTVVSAQSPEQMVLGKLTVLALRDEGFQVVDKTGLGSGEATRLAMETGRADVIWEYTGETWLTYQAHELPVRDPRELYDGVRQDDIQRGICWLSPTSCERNMTLLVRAADAQNWKMGRISDIKSHIEGKDPFFRLCAPPEIYRAPSGISGMERVYGLRFHPDYVQLLTLEEGYQALQDGRCDCAIGYSADPESEPRGLQALVDDGMFFMRSSLAVAARAPVLEQTPGLRESLSRLSSGLTREALTEMTRRVVVEQAKPEDVAKRFLRDQATQRARQEAAQ
ncbi:MAG: ABC transporter substrate-binding protein [Anaerolineae bacterium]